MVKTNYYSGLNPVVLQALNNLQYSYSGETPEIWYSRVCYPFKTLLENNPKYFSKNFCVSKASVTVRLRWLSFMMAL